MSETTSVGLLGTLIERWRGRAAAIRGNTKGTAVEDMSFNRALTFDECADELLAALPPAPQQGQEQRMIEVLGKALDTDERQMADLVRQLNHWKKKATELDAKLAASPPAQAQEQQTKKKT